MLKQFVVIIVWVLASSPVFGEELRAEKVKRKLEECLEKIAELKEKLVVWGPVEKSEKEKKEWEKKFSKAGDDKK